MGANLEKLSLVELLDQLRPIVVPEPVSYVPQTAGWAVLATMFVFALALLLWRQWGRWRTNAYRRAALSSLANLRTNPSLDDQKTLTELASLVRRCAIEACSRSSIAALHGDDWLRFLERSGAGQKFTDGIGRHLVTGPYRADIKLTSVERIELLDLIQTWIGTHRVPQVDD
jgi:Domain of unknown function (DUF4381)